MNIVKASGEKEKFKEEKIVFSLERVGLNHLKAKEIAKEVKGLSKSGIRSETILDVVIDLLKRDDPMVAIKYNLKRALMNLGPSGYPFEKYFAGILKEYGYEVSVGEIVQGHCVNQEVDIIATKGNKRYMVECKHHSSSGLRSDLKVALYTYARFLDVKEAWMKDRNPQKFHQAILVTNTRCTSEALKFASCRKVDVIAWHYPQNNNLEELIEKKSLYPITILFSLSDKAKTKLLKNNIVFAKDLINIDYKKFAKKTGVGLNELKKLNNEVQLIYDQS